MDVLNENIDSENTTEEKINMKDDYSLNWGSLITKDGITIDEPIKKRRGRKPASEKAMVADDSAARRIQPAAKPQMPLCQTTDPYIRTYDETQNLLRGTIAQIDSLTYDVNTQLAAIKDSRTIKGKYKYISDLAMTQSGLINAKLNAIREINKTITDTHNLELRRMKDNQAITNEKDDDKRIMDLYNAFIKTPVSAGVGGYAALGPDIQQTALLESNGINRVGVDSYGNAVEDIGYQQYLNNLTPEQNRMRFEKDPNIQTVVVYDQSTGDRHFDVIDMRTGQSVPNMAIPDQFLLENMTINLRTGTARNSNANMDFPLVVVGNPGSINDF